MKKEYRIVEYCGVFDIEVMGYKIIGILWWTKKVYSWCKPNIWGGVRQTFPSLQPICKSFKTLEKAQEQVKEFKKGRIYHQA
jgi:hypothetical protein